jgi:hypothetical protein
MMTDLRFTNDTVEKNFEDARAKGKEFKLLSTWNRCVDTLSRLAGKEGHVVVSHDSAPLSFGWAAINAEGKCTMNGGMIFHGAHDGGGNGQGPTYSICLNPTDGWAIHT